MVTLGASLVRVRVRIMLNVRVNLRFRMYVPIWLWRNDHTSNWDKFETNWYVPKWFVTKLTVIQMDQVAPMWSRVDEKNQNLSSRSRVVQSGSKGSTLIKSDQKDQHLSSQTKKTKIDEVGAKWSKLIQSGPKGSKLFHSLQSGPSFFSFSSFCSQWNKRMKIDQVGPK